LPSLSDFDTERKSDKYRMGTPELTIAVPTRNRTDILVKCLKKIYRQTFADWELIIVDDNDEDNLQAYRPFQRVVKKIRQKGHSVRILRGSGRKEGFPVHNIALEAAQTELVMRVDDDVLLDPAFIKMLVPLFSDPSVGVASGCMHRHHSFYEDQTNPGKNALQFYRTGNGFRWEWDLDVQFYRHRQPAVHIVEHIHSSYVYRKSALESVGGFNEDLSDNGEETMCQLKMALKGYKILIHTAVSCIHLYADGGWRNSPRKLDTQTNLERNLRELFKDLEVQDGDCVKDIIRRNGLEQEWSPLHSKSDPQEITL
jgi:glycosyltransferase involved in cell wall biosynthesis